MKVFSGGPSLVITVHHNTAVRVGTSNGAELADKVELFVLSESLAS